MVNFAHKLKLSEWGFDCDIVIKVKALAFKDEIAKDTIEKYILKRFVSTIVQMTLTKA